MHSTKWYNSRFEEFNKHDKFYWIICLLNVEEFVKSLDIINNEVSKTNLQSTLIL